jgi:hypothetical protein
MSLLWTNPKLKLVTRINGGIGFPYDAKEGGRRTTTQPLYTSTQTYPPIINFLRKKSIWTFTTFCS